MELDKSNPKLKEILDHTTSDNNDEAIAKVRVKIIGKDIDGKEVSKEYRYIDKDYFDSLSSNQDTLPLIAFDKIKEEYYFVDILVLKPSDSHYHSSIEILDEKLCPLDEKRFKIIPQEENLTILDKHRVTIGYDGFDLTYHFKLLISYFLIWFSVASFLFSLCGGPFFLAHGHFDRIYTYGPIALAAIILPGVFSYFFLKNNKESKRLFLILSLNDDGSLKYSSFKQTKCSLGKEALTLIEALKK